MPTCNLTLIVLQHIAGNFFRAFEKNADFNLNLYGRIIHGTIYLQTEGELQ